MRGHIRRRGEGTWELKFDLGRDPLTGKRQVRYVSFKGTKREAQAELTRLLAASATGQLIDPSKATVAEFLERWERDWASINVSRKTAERYSDLIRKHVVPHLGTLPVQKLKPVYLNELYAKLLRDGLAPRTVGHVHRVVHRALGHAARWGVVAQNVASLVSPPPVAAEEIETLTAAQVQSVLVGLRGRILGLMATTLLATGMRRGELLALRWQDVDLAHGRLRVEQSLEQTKAGLRFKSPKTKHGRRLISLPPSLVAELRAHHKAQQGQRLALGLGKAPTDALVFATWDGKTRSPNALTKQWTVAMKAAGFPNVTLHSLRHTHASHLIASGMDVLTISRRLGHGSPTITLGVYGHLFPNTDDRAAQIMEVALAPIRTE
jgi:integrase